MNWKAHRVLHSRCVSKKVRHPERCFTFPTWTVSRNLFANLVWILGPEFGSELGSDLGPELEQIGLRGFPHLHQATGSDQQSAAEQTSRTFFDARRLKNNVTL